MAFSLHFVFYLILYISALVANKRVRLYYTRVGRSNPQPCIATMSRVPKSQSGRRVESEIDQCYLASTDWTARRRRSLYIG